MQITFDQLRGDLLERYDDLFTGGFRRVLDQGWYVRRGDVAHAITNSFPGHAALATGMTPSHHGLTANEWLQLQNGRWTSVDALADPRYPVVGAPAGRAYSPHNLTASSIGDWVKAKYPRAKVIALGSQSSMIYAGRSPDAVYWYDGGLGRFVTSTYYKSGHGWVEAVNSGLPGRPRTWTLSVPASAVSRARRDASAYENGGRNNVFPHEYASEAQSSSGEVTPFGRWFGETPMKDDAMFDLARLALDAERLGQRDTTDYLALTAESTDAVGHAFGPNSLEQLDNLLRLDRSLGGFLDHLDRTVGQDRYVLAVSADHGVADPPEEHGIRRVRTADIDTLLDRVDRLAEAHHGTRAQLVASIVNELKRSDFIADAYAEERLASPREDDPFAELYKRSFRPGYTPDFPLWSSKYQRHHPARYGIVVRFKEGMIFDYAAAVHGTPYPYDRLVPVIFYGAGVPARTLATGARTIDVAPTLAALAGIEAPRVDGRVLVRSAATKAK